MKHGNIVFTLFQAADWPIYTISHPYIRISHRFPLILFIVRIFRYRVSPFGKLIAQRELDKSNNINTQIDSVIFV